MTASEDNLPSNQSGNTNGGDDNEATHNAKPDVKSQSGVQDNVEEGSKQDPSSPSECSNKESSIQSVVQIKEEATGTVPSDEKNPPMSHPIGGKGSMEERNASSGNAVTMGTPSHTFGGGMTYPSPANYPIQGEGPHYSSHGEAQQMRGSPMGPMGSGVDAQQWRHYNPRDPHHPGVSGGGSYIPHSNNHGPQSPYHRNHYRHTMGSPAGRPAVGRGRMYGGFSPDYDSPSRYYETFHNMAGSGMGVTLGHGQRESYGMHPGTMSSPYHLHPMHDNVIHRSGARMGSPSGVAVPPNYSSPYANTTNERLKRPYEDVSPAHLASEKKKEEQVQREKERGEPMSTTSGAMEVVRHNGEKMDNASNVQSPFVETPEKDEKRQRVEQSIDVKTSSTESKYQTLVGTPSNQEISSSKGETSQQEPHAGSESAPTTDPRTSTFDIKHQASDRAGGLDAPGFYPEHGGTRAGGEVPFPSPEGLDVPYRGYARGRFEGAPGGGYYDEPPPSHGGYYPPPPPHAYPGYGPPPPPPSHGYYYDGTNDYYPGTEYDNAMYYNRMYGVPGPGYMHSDPHNVPPPPGMLRTHPRTPYGAPYGSFESPPKPYVTPDSRPFVASGQGANPHGMGWTPATNFPPRHPVEEGEYTKLVRSKTVRLTDRKKLQNKAWYDRFEDLKKYKEEHGDCMVPQKYPPNPR